MIKTQSIPRAIVLTILLLIILPWVGRIAAPVYFDRLYDPEIGTNRSTLESYIGAIVLWLISIGSGVICYFYLSKQKFKKVDWKKAERRDFWIRVFLGLIILALILVIVFNWKG